MTQQDIGARAYELWEKEGRPNGRDLAHWLEAERMLQRQVAAPAAAVCHQRGRVERRAGWRQRWPGIRHRHGRFAAGRRKQPKS